MSNLISSTLNNIVAALQHNTSFKLLEVINFTEHKILNSKSFAKYNPQVKELLIKVNSSTESSFIVIVDKAENISVSEEDNKIGLVTDHLNLSTHNPLLGPNNDNLGPRFFALNNLYFNLPDLTNCFKPGKELIDCLKEVKTVNLNYATKPTLEEISKLEELRVNNFTYNLVLTSLVAAHKGLKVLAFTISD